MNLELKVAGIAVMARLSGALWIRAARALIVADAHFEKGSAYAARGQLLPPYDTAETLSRLEAEALALDPRMIVFLGDAWHDGRAGERMAADAARRLATLAAGRELIWIAGNHDPEPPAQVPGERLAAMSLNGLDLVHEPSPRPALGEIAGHLHPCARVAGAGRRRCFAGDGERMVLPAFGAFAGGLNVRDPAIRGLLGRAPDIAVLGTRAVHAVPWARLGRD